MCNEPAPKPNDNPKPFYIVILMHLAEILAARFEKYQCMKQ